MSRASEASLMLKIAAALRIGSQFPYKRLMLPFRRSGIELRFHCHWSRPILRCRHAFQPYRRRVQCRTKHSVLIRFYICLCSFQDHAVEVRRDFLDKVHRRLVEKKLLTKWAVVLSLATVDDDREVASNVRIRSLSSIASA